MLILRVPRWGVIQPFLADEALVNGTFLGVDAEPWQPPRPWATPQRAAFLADEDVLPRLWLEDEPWVPPQPWPVRQGGAWLADEDVLPLLLALDEGDAWQPPLRQHSTPHRLFATNDADELPLFCFLDDTGWQAARPWNETNLRAPTGQGTEDFPLFFFLDEADWRLLSPWMRSTTRLWGDPGSVLAELPASFVLDEPGWHPAQPWQNQTARLWNDAGSGIAESVTPFSLEETSWGWHPDWQPWRRLLYWDTETQLPPRLSDETGWVPRLPWTSQTFRTWSDTGSGLTESGAPVSFDETGWFPPRVSQEVWKRLLWWDDETFVSGFLADDAWHSPQPWSVARVGFRWVPDEFLGESAFALYEDAWLPPTPWPTHKPGWLPPLTDELYSELRIDEQYWYRAPLWAEPWLRKAFQAENELVQGAYFWLFDDAWQPPRPWPVPQVAAILDTPEWVEFVPPVVVVIAEFEEEQMAGTPTLWQYDTVAEDLDWCQAFLKDTRIPGTDGDIWTREELLTWYQDGYRDLIRDAETTRRFSILRVPPQWTYTGTWPWEEQFAQGGTFQVWTVGNRPGLAASSLWELEVVEGYQGQRGGEAITQGWERTFLNPQYTPFRFGLARNHLRIQKMWYDHALLVPVDVRSLDWTYRNWVSLGGEQMAWTMGTGDIRSYEVYEIQTAPTQDYTAQRDLGESDGMLRHLSGDRTYTVDYDDDTPTAVGFAWTTEGEAAALTQRTLQDLTEGPGLRLTGEPTSGGYQGTYPWEAAVLDGGAVVVMGKGVGTFAWEAAYDAESIQLCPGVIRGLSSPDRQYWPVVYDVDQLPLGKIDELRSSHAALLCLEVIEPDAPELLEQDLPGMLPPQMQKYLKYYTLARAFNRQGEGYQPALASVWLMRYKAGARMLRFLKMIQRRDTQKSRQPVVGRSRTPRPRLPSTYPNNYE